MVEGVGGCGKVGEDGPFGEGGGVHELSDGERVG